MDADAAEALLRHYLLRSGDDARPRLNTYVLAYSVFQGAYCSMAAFALSGTEEELRLDGDVNYYQLVIERELRRTMRAALPLSPIGANVVTAQR